MLKLCHILLCFLLLSPAFSYAKLSDNQENYVQALDALKKGNLDRFNELQDSLSGYALSPYLEYKELRYNNYRDTAAIQDFLRRYPNQAISHRLKLEWLLSLPGKNQWQSLVNLYDSQLYSKELRCYYLRGLYKTGNKKEALLETKSMWVSGTSAPKACNPLFKVWLKSSFFKQEYAYERVKLALKKRKTSLASYASNFLKGDMKHAAQMMIWAHKSPGILSSTKRFPAANPYMKDAIIHGVKRRVRKKPDAALVYWKKHRNRFSFSPSEIHTTEKRIYLGLARQYDKNASNLLSSLNRDIDSEEILEWQIRVSLRNRDWDAVLKWIGKLSETGKMEDDWVYWQHQAYYRQGKPVPQYIAQEFLKLAKQRSYYGFLAAEHLGRSLSLIDIPLPISGDQRAEIRQLPELVRAKELFSIGHTLSAQREWQFAVNNLDQKGLMALAEAANDLGWHNRAIRAVISANHWNDLAIRFPTPHKKSFGKAANRVKLPPSWLFAIARQESAFMAKAKSSAGARGLMQLMPATAKQTAKKIGVSSKNSLYEPEYNIRLGSSYLSMMHKRFNNNRALATAAYNAGPHRVDRWIKSAIALPIDAWVETIPYDETRRYVKNVLAFDAIYQHKLGNKKPYLYKPHEKVYLGRKLDDSKQESANGPKVASIN